MENKREMTVLELLTVTTNKKTFEIIKWSIAITVFSFIMAMVLPIFYLVIALNIVYTIFRLVIHIVWYIKAKNKLIKNILNGKV